MKNQKQYLIQGIITSSDKKPLKGLLVKAFDLDFSGEKLLGAPVYTDENGCYKIIYTDNDFKPTGIEKGGADIVIHVFNSDGKFLKKTEPHNNAGKETTINIIISKPIPEPEPVEEKYTVSGNVTLSNMQPVSGYKVEAYDIDLRNKQKLGDDYTNLKGFYSIKYDYENFKKSEKNSADLQIIVLDEKNNIIAESDIFFNVPLEFNINIVIDETAITPYSEFELILSTISPLINKLSIDELDETDKYQDITFLSGETGFSIEQIAWFCLSYRMQNISKIDVHFWYALLCKKYYALSMADVLNKKSLRLQVMTICSSFPPHNLEFTKKILTQSIFENKISSYFEDKIEGWINDYEQFIIDKVTKDTIFSDSVCIKKIFDITDLPLKKKQITTKLYLKHGSINNKFISEIINDKSFNDKEIEDLKITFKINDLLKDNNYELVSVLKKEKEAEKYSTVCKLAEKSPLDWKQLIEKNKISIPKEILDFNPVFTIEMYAEMIHVKFINTYPTCGFLGSLKKAHEILSESQKTKKKSKNKDEEKDIKLGIKYSKEIIEFLDKYPEFEFLNTSINKFIKTKKENSKKFHPIIRELKVIQRIFKLHPDYNTTNNLLLDNINSSKSIYFMGESQFVKKYENRIGFTRTIAKEIYSNAASTYSAVLAIVGEIRSNEESNLFKVLRTREKEKTKKYKSASGPGAGTGSDSDIETDLSELFPNWKNIFGGTSICEYENCRSVLSPASYLADIIHFLENRESGTSSDTIKHIILKRRPETCFIDLNCENAYIPIPYIDVVNEILEDYIDSSPLFIIKNENLPDTGGPVPAAVKTIFEDNNYTIESPEATLSQKHTTTDKTTYNFWIIRDEKAVYIIKENTDDLIYEIYLSRQTHGTEKERKAFPEYVNTKTYNLLKTKKNCFKLPFDLYNEEVKYYLEKARVKRWEIMEIFKGNIPPNNPSNTDIACAYFGIYKDEQPIILHKDPDNQFEYWNELDNNAAISKTSEVSIFLKKTGLHYKELQKLLTIQFINPDNSIKILHTDSSCDIETKVLQSLDTYKLDRINRFLRLWKKLDWEMWELDLVIFNPKIGRINKEELILHPESVDIDFEDLIKNLKPFEEIRKSFFNLSVEQLCVLFDDINTRLIFKEVYKEPGYSLYHTLFLNDKIIKPIDEVYKLQNINGTGLPHSLTGHKSTIMAALKLKESDLDILINLEKHNGSSFININLTLANLSFLYRHKLITKLLKIKIIDWAIIIKLSLFNKLSFDTTQEAFDFFKKIKTIKESNFNIMELDYLLSCSLNQNEKVAIEENKISQFIVNMRNELKKISNDYDTNPSNPDSSFNLSLNDINKMTSLLTAQLQTLKWGEKSISDIISILNNTKIFSVELDDDFYDTYTALDDDEETNKKLQDDFNSALSSENIKYDSENNILILNGILTVTQKNNLLTNSDIPPQLKNKQIYKDTIQALYVKPRNFISDNLKFYETPVYTVSLNKLPPIINFTDQLESPLLEKIFYDPEQQIIGFKGSMSAEEKTILISLASTTDTAYASYTQAIENLYNAPSTTVFNDNELWIKHTDFTTYFNNPSNINVLNNLSEFTKRVLIYLKKKLIKSCIIQQFSENLNLSQALTECILTNYELFNSPYSACLSIYESLIFINSNDPISSEIQNTITSNIFKSYYWLHRVSILINKLNINYERLKWMQDFISISGIIDLKTLPLSPSGSNTASLDALINLNRFIQFNNIYSKTELSFFDVIKNLNNNVYTSNTDFANDITVLTEWNNDDIKKLTDTDVLFTNYKNNLKNISNWERLKKAIQLLNKVNSSAESILSFAGSIIGIEESNKIKKLIKSKYEDDQWLDICQDVQDKLREKKRDSLVSYILTSNDPGSPTGKWENSNDVFAYFLIDTQMNSCMQTSRIVQACSAIQLFVQRCFLKLEPEVEINETELDEYGNNIWKQWKWMSKYRVWEANRKIFLYPENHLEPEFRFNKSPFFKDLENDLLQKDISKDNVETAFLNYLEKLDNVAQLEIAGYYYDDKIDTLYVFGRTQGADPHIYYYRKLIRNRYWTAWEKIEVDITGSHLIPLKINTRLYICWPIFSEIPVEEEKNDIGYTGQSSVKSRNSMDKPFKSLKIQLAICEFRNKKWQPKKISTDFIESSNTYNNEIDKSKFYFKARKNNESYIICCTRTDEKCQLTNDAFEIFGCKGFPVIVPYKNKINELENKVSDSYWKYMHQIEDKTRSSNYFSFIDESQKKNLELVLNQTPDIFKAFTPVQDSFIERYYNYSNHGVYLPYFYSDKSRTFFVQTFFYNGNRLFLYKEMKDKYEDKKSYFLYLLKEFSFFKFIVSLLSIMKYRHYWEKRHPMFEIYIKKVNHYFNTIKNQLAQGPDYDFFNFLIMKLKNIDIHNLKECDLSSEYDDSIKQKIKLFKKVLFAVDYIYLNINYYVLSIVFGNIAAVIPKKNQILFNKKYLYNNFYHPFICSLIFKLNTKGIEGLMQRAAQLQNYKIKPYTTSSGKLEVKLEYTGFKYEEEYDPTDKILGSSSEMITNTYSAPLVYPKEEMDFSLSGSYSIYNWELFYHSPFMIALKLSSSQKFKEAMDWFHYIFNPSDSTGNPAPQKFWITKPFFEHTSLDYKRQRIENIFKMLSNDPSGLDFSSEEEIEIYKKTLQAHVADWRGNFCDPHLIAQFRDAAYQKTTVMKYIDNLIKWGDLLFRQDSMETINQAVQLYILAAEILGPRPEKVPPQAKPEIKSYNELTNPDDFSNSLLDAENLIPPLFDGELLPFDAALSPDLKLFYFNIPHNEKILEYWDTVADRLYKIRNGLNIDGIKRSLSLFEPPIDLDSLLSSLAGGMDLSSALRDLNAPLPYYRFTIMLQKANELCDEVKSFGSAILSAIEKRDAEGLALLRQTHEINILNAVKEIKKEQVAEAQYNLDGLYKNKEIIKSRYKFHKNRVRWSAGEITAISLSGLSLGIHATGVVLDFLAGVLTLIPDFKAGVSGVAASPVATTEIPSGDKAGKSTKNAGNGLYQIAAILDKSASLSSTISNYKRRNEEWDFQEETARKEIEQIEIQIKAAKKRLAISEKELKNQELQIENSNAVNDYMQNKFSNEKLYQWMINETSSLFFQTYNIAFDYAKNAEKCFQFELGISNSKYIQYGYWNDLKKGLMSGEKLQYDLRRLEKAYFEFNRREFEISKTVSLLQINPYALIKLKETGYCDFNIPEELFDLDFPGHYFRRIKSVSITIPCIAGPYTSINCMLRLLKNTIRIKTSDGDMTDTYEHNNDQGIWIDDSRFVTINIPVKTIAASSAQNDSGMFDLNFRDERYIPFEGAGVISSWLLELPHNPDDLNDKSLRQFDYETISDVIINIQYTSREDAGSFKLKSINHLKNIISSNSENFKSNINLLNLKQEFSSEWYKFLNKDVETDENIFTISLSNALFPYITRQMQISIKEIHILAKIDNDDEYKLRLSPPLQIIDESKDLIKLTKQASLYGDLHHGLIKGLEIIIDENKSEWIMKIKKSGGNYNEIKSNEIQEMFLLLIYSMEIIE